MSGPSIRLVKHHLDSTTSLLSLFTPTICRQLAQQLQSMALALSLSQMLSPARIPMLTIPVPPLVCPPRVASSVCGVVLAIPNESSGEKTSWTTRAAGRNLQKVCCHPHLAPISASLPLFIVLTRFLVCCIYHKPRAFDESSSESSSDSDSGDSRHGHSYPRRHRHNGHRHSHEPSSDSYRQSASSSATGNTPLASSSATATETQDPVHEQSDSDSGNAYEARPSKRYKAYRADGQRHS